MTSDTVLPRQPAHPLPQLTTYELRDYRRQLEHAISDLSPGAPVQRELRRRLDEVIAEQDDRAAAVEAPADT